MPYVEEALINSKLFAVSLPVIVASTAVKLLIVPVDELKLVIVPDDVVSSDIVVVAKLELPIIVRVPLAKTFPNSSAKNPRFSIQFEPSHLSVELVAVPTKTAPKTVFQNVVVPVDKRT